MNERIPKTNKNAENTNDGIGPRLAVIRENAKIGQAELARQLGISRFALNRWERGHRSISAEQIGPTCRALGIDPAGLLGVRLEMPLPSVNRRLLKLLQAEGTETAGRRLEVDQAAMSAVMKGKLQVAESELEGLAEAYGVSFAWLLTGKPELWTPSMEMSWKSRLRFFRVSIGGFKALRDVIENPEEAESTVRLLDTLFRDGERSEAEARAQLRGTSERDIPALVASLRVCYTQWSNELKHDFPFDFNGLCVENPRFKS